MITINGNSITLNDIYNIVFKNTPFEVDKDALNEVTKSYNFLKEFSQKKLIYGINTGFGPMAQYRIDDSELVDLQYNIIRSHSSGLNSYLEEPYAKAVLINLLNAMLRGLSGIHPDLIRTITEMLAKGIHPCIPVHGGVGASGDLVQMAHVALGIIGEGDVYCDGQITDAAEAFAKKAVTPFKVHIREGISIMNGTTAMTAVASINLYNAQNALEWSLALSSCINEMMESYDDHYSVGLNSAKKQSGQMVVAKAMEDFVAGSQKIHSRKELYKNRVEETHIKHKVQPFYSLRCVPQILGPVYDSIVYSQQIVENELNSTTDNPIVNYNEENVYHGGNFHGDYISLEMDKLKLVVTRVTMLAERQLNYLVNPAINGCLQPFVNSGKLGLNFGFQGIQFTATSTTAENQALSTSHYIHSIPNNNDNQDIVSMGFNAAYAAKRVVENAFEVLAIQSAATIQAIDMLGCKNQLSVQSQKMYDNLRQIFPPYKEDRSTRKDMLKLKDYMIANPLQILFKR